MSKQAARWLQIIITGFVGVVLTACAIPGQEAPAAQSTATVQTKWKTLSGQAPLVIAHRGASGERPEHTLEAYDLAIDQGADFIEPDLVITKDGQLVARHDRYLSGSTNVSELEEFADRKVIKPGKAQADWYVEDFTLAELKTLRARQPRDGRSKAYDDKHEIPTFEDVLQLVVDRSEETGRRIGIYPETKQPAALEALGFSFNAPLLAALKRHGYDGADDPVFIQSFEVENLKRLNTKTDVRLVYLIARPPEETPSEIASFADGIGAYKLLVSQNGQSTGLIEAAHAEGLPVHIWTLREDDIGEGFQNGSDEQCHYVSLGIDGAFTDFPGEWVACLDRVSAN